MLEFENRKATEDEAMGMAWWNSLSEVERILWANKAGTGVAADAWAMFKAENYARSYTGVKEQY